MEYQLHTLKNGIRLIHKQVDSPVAHCGILVHTGSRDEEDHEHGMAHFVEHVLFKGTRKRKAFHILSRLENVGGDLNAYTTKEETCIHASFMAFDYQRVLELFSDIMFNSTFPEKELEKEKEVIIDEINSYKDNPGELIFDEFEEQIYHNAPIGRNILGSEESVKHFTRAGVIDFIKEHYHTNQMVFSSVGNIPFNKLIRLFERYFSDVPVNEKKSRRTPFSNYTSSVHRVQKNTYQNHCIIGNLAYDIRNERRIGLGLLNNILGGQGLNSRLNLSLREKYGYAYNVESNYNPYFDSGVLSIYFGTDHENLEKSIQLVHKECTKLRTSPLGTLQLSRAKKQILGQIAISSESYENQMLSMAKGCLLFGKVDSLKEIQQKIERIRAHDILEIANEILAPDQLSMLIYE